MIKNIIFDFDGVILNSVPIKTEAFRELFKEFPSKSVNKLIEYHLMNGGISRYKKIEYFFKKILYTEIDEVDIIKYANNYSELTKKELSKEKYIIRDTFEYIKANYKKYNMYIASGADEGDLNFICNKLNLNYFFLSINGSPKMKSEIIKDILIFNNYKQNETILIGDSMNDFEASKINKIAFYGFNNLALEKFNYIRKFNIDYKFNNKGIT